MPILGLCTVYNDKTGSDKKVHMNNVRLLPSTPQVKEYKYSMNPPFVHTGELDINKNIKIHVDYDLYY